MSSKVSNLYAAKIFSEHPIGLWALDDDFSFISLLSASGKFIENWDFTGGEIVEVETIPPNLPIQEQTVFNVIKQSSSVELLEILSEESFNPQINIDFEKKSVSLNAFIYQYFNSVEYYEIGFKYYDPELDEEIYNFTRYESEQRAEWQKISHYFEIINKDVDIYSVIKIKYLDNIEIEQSKLAILGISLGQWSESFYTDTTGSIVEDLDEESLVAILPSASTSYKVVKADSYGLSLNNGYYFVENNKMLCTNSNLPMLFGSSNLTTINHSISTNFPSLVIPGKGFLNEFGKYSEKTFEFWLRVNPTSSVKKKIFGPLTNSDGLYISNDFISFKINKNEKSYFMNKWYRPMLIDIRYREDLIQVFINGDLVISIEINSESLTLSDSEKDWLGFFGHSDIHPYDLDCIAIYPYAVPDQIMKRRFIYGQGVESEENVVSNFYGESYSIDFPFAKYTANISYPDMNVWNSGYFNNLSVDSKSIKMIDYTTPELNGIENIEEFLTVNFENQDEDYPFISFRISEDYSEDYNFSFDSINEKLNTTRSLLAVLKSSEEVILEEQFIMYFSNNSTLETFRIVLEGELLKYIYFDGNEDVLIKQKIVNAGDYFLAGLDFKKISSTYSLKINKFFNSLSNVSFLFGGFEDSVFKGKIFALHIFDDFYNNWELFSYFDVLGFAGGSQNNASISISTNSFIFDYIGPYTFSPIIKEDFMILDVSSAGYWEDSIPLSYFGSPVLGKTGKTYYDLDMLQFNIDTPVSITMEDTNYEENSENFSIKSYITFENFSEVGQVGIAEYNVTVKTGEDKVIDVSDVNTVFRKKFQVSDNTVIFPPKGKGVSFADYYITIHLDIRVRGINNTKLNLQKMSLASLAFDESSFYSIKSKTGRDIYPFSRSNKVYLYKNKNPFSIYKDTTPYTYLTGDSGIQVLPYPSSATRGITIPLNQEKSSEFIIGAIQFWFMYNKKTQFDKTIPLGLLRTRTNSYQILLEPYEDGKRGILKIIDNNLKTIYSNVTFYQNRFKMDNPIIEPTKWNSVLISFGEEILLNNFIGQLELYEGFVFNNISIFKKTDEVLEQKFFEKKWSDYYIVDNVVLRWNQILDKTWSKIYFESETTTFSVDGIDLFESYFGLPKVTAKDAKSLNVSSDSILIHSDNIWENYFEIV